MSKEIYNRLEILSPWSLRKDVFKNAKSNNYPAESLQFSTDVELLKLKMAQLYVLPQSQTRILQQEKESSKSMQRSTIDLKFFDVRDPKSIAKHSNTR